jgi:hypothetical protein
MSTANTPTANESAAPKLPDRLRAAAARARALPRWASENRKKAVLIGFGGLAVVLTVAVGLKSIVHPKTTLAEKQQFATALVALDAADFSNARYLAKQLLESETYPRESLGGPLFVIGMVTATEASTQWDTHDRRQMYLIAARYLEESRDRGFPTGREGQGLFHLGKSQFETGHYAQCIPSLLESEKNYPQARREARRMLSLAYLHDDPPRLEEALSWNRKFLADDQLTAEQRESALLDEAKILLAKDDLAGCRAALARIPATAFIRHEATVLETRLLLKETEDVSANERPRVQALYAQAVEALRTVQGRDTLGGVATRQASYLLGVMYLKLGEQKAASKQFARTREVYANTPEGAAAALAEAEILAQLNDDVSARAIYKTATKMAGSPETYRNPWVSLSQFRQRLKTAYHAYVEKQGFAAAIALADSMPPIVVREEALELKARAQRAWAQHLLRQAEREPHPRAEKLKAEARFQFRESARSYAALARSHRTERRYRDDLWHTADGLLQGQDYAAAVQVLTSYLTDELPERRARVLVALGESLAALGRRDEALKSLDECIEFHPKSPVVFRARLLAAFAHEEKHDYAAAKKLLLENLHHDALTPQSAEWRQSLFALGKIHYYEGRELESKSRLVDRPVGSRLTATADVANVADEADQQAVEETLQHLTDSAQAFEDAIYRLREAKQRYPDSADAVLARYLIAEAHRRTAALPLMKINVTRIKTHRENHAAQAKTQLLAAIADFRELEEYLNAKQDKATLSPLESRVLRNCYFALGDTFFELGSLDNRYYEDAIRAYSTATNRYQHKPESLEAYVQIATCFQQLNKPHDARGILEQAKTVLNRMDENAAFEETTRYSREQWSDLLAWLAPVEE